jgi:hypothetical protein
MAAPPWLRDVLVVVGKTGVKALREGMREGAANALDSVLEDFEGFTHEVTKRVREGRSTLRDNVRKSKARDARNKPSARKTEPPEVIEAEIIEEE